MKFTIATQELNYLISKCLNLIPQKPAIPILSNLLVEAANGMLTITATDLMVGVRCFTEVNITEEGATTLPAKRFAQLIRELTAVNVEIHTKANEVTEVIADGSRFRMHGMGRNEFPALPDLEGAMRFTIAQSALKELLFQTSFAVSREDNRYVLTGVNLQISEGKATFSGTDGKRLARTRAAIAIDPGFSGNFVIPFKAIDEVLKNLTDDGEMTVYLIKDKIAFEMSNMILITKLLSGDYPDVSRVIPQAFENIVSLHREELITLLRQVSLFTSELNHAVRFAFSPGELFLSANSKEGEGKVSMPVNYQGKPLEIAFNPTFFLDILRHNKGESVKLGISDSFNPGVITDHSSDQVVVHEANPLFVLMPMRLYEEVS